MRLIAGTKRGVRVLRWIAGERMAALRTRALEAEEIRAAVQRGSTVFVGTGNGKAFASSDGGRAWKPVLEGLQCDAVCCLAAGRGETSPVLAGTEPAALFLLGDDDDAWREIESFREMEAAEGWRGYGDRRAHVQAIEVDPHAEKRLFVGVEIGGAYASRDGGRSWHVIGDGLYEDVHQLAVDPRRGTRMYAATGGGLYVSDDRGRSWKEHPEEVGSLYCTALRAGSDRAGTSILYLATAGGTPASWPRRGARARVHVSRDGGSSWSEAAIGARRMSKEAYTAIAPDPTNREGIFVATSGGTIYHGRRNGDRWSAIYRGTEAILTLLVI
jgi:phage pi2 protein 07